MRTRFICFAVIIAVYNFIVFLFFANNYNSYIGPALIIIGTLIFSLLFYKWIIKPVEALQMKLYEANEENRKAEIIRSEFVANVSHELKTPLTSILGFIETLQDGAAENPETRGRFLDIIAIETSRLKRLIEDLLVLSDIENKKQSFNMGEIYIFKTISEIVSSIEPIAMARNIEIVMNIERDAVISGSEDRFKQMMLNLIENSIKYSKEGGKVTISTELIENGERLALSVSDNGIGISEEHIKRLFERFYRVDKSRSTKAGGTGLGLSIVKHIANLFEAELQVESVINKGSNFKVIFPLK